MLIKTIIFIHLYICFGIVERNTFASNKAASILLNHNYYFTSIHNSRDTVLEYLIFRRMQVVLKVSSLSSLKLEITDSAMKIAMEPSISSKENNDRNNENKYNEKKEQ